MACVADLLLLVLVLCVAIRELEKIADRVSALEAKVCELEDELRGSQTQSSPVEHSDVEVCWICYDELDPDSPATRTLPCEHQVHHCCVDRWLNTAGSASTCGLCRRPILSSVHSQSTPQPAEPFEYEVVAILNRSYDFKRRTYKYKVQWAAPSSSSSVSPLRTSWEPVTNLVHSAELIRVYDEAHPRTATRRSARVATRSLSPSRAPMARRLTYT